MWGVRAGTQPVIPALWSSLTKREAGTAQPARTHTCTNTQTVTQIHTDRGKGARVKPPPSAPPPHFSTPSLSPLIPWAEGHTPSAVRFQAAAAGNTLFSSSFLHTHTDTQTHTQGAGTAGEKRCKKRAVQCQEEVKRGRREDKIQAG